MKEPLKTDRFGNPRCSGYRREDYELCPSCCAGFKDGDNLDSVILWIDCRLCGGYGEVPNRMPSKSKTRWGWVGRDVPVTGADPAPRGQK